MKKAIVLILLIVGLNSISYSQKQRLFELDTINGLLTESIPFDSPFVLKIEAKEEINYVDLIQTKKGRKWHEEISRKRFLDKIFNYTPRINVVKSEGINHKKIDGKNYAFITFKDRPNNNTTLRPNKDYSILVNYGDPNVFPLYHKFSRNKQKESLKQALDDLKKKQLNKVGLIWLIPETEEALEIYNNKKLDSKFLTYDSLIVEQQRLVGKVQPLSLNSILRCLVSDTTIFKCINSCEDGDFLVQLDQENSHTENLQNLLNGFHLNGVNRSASICNRSNLLSAFSTRVNKLFLKIQQVYLSGICDLDKEQYEGLKEFVGLVNNASRVLKELCTIKNTITRAFYSAGVHTFPTEINASSTTYEYTARVRSYLKPDFGVIAYGLKDEFTGVAPYLGVHLNFVPLNKDIPWRAYPNRSFWKYPSLLFGTTLSSIAESGRREDLYGSSSLITGIGMKLFSHSLMLTGGLLWFNEVDPNPIIDRKSLAFSPFLGLSADLEIREILNGFETIFKK